MKHLMEKWNRFLNEKSFSDFSGGKKGSWVDLPTDELKSTENVDIANEIFDLIDRTYTPIGGNLDIQKVSDIPSDYSDWSGINIDDDPDMDAIAASKSKPHGKKMTLAATDGSDEATKKVKEKTSELLNTPGHYGELSHAIAHVMMKYFKPPFVDNKEDVSSVLGKDIEWIGPHPEGLYPDYPGWYRRNIGGRPVMKIMLGRPNI